MLEELPPKVLLFQLFEVADPLKASHVAQGSIHLKLVDVEQTQIALNVITLRG